MFTGLVEEVGRLAHRRLTPQGGSLRIACTGLQGDLKLGDSVAVNGVCLTVTDFDPQGFTADVMAATLAGTTLGDLPLGSALNLERALRLQDRLGGHIVSGHVDGIARVTALDTVGDALRVRLEAPADCRRYLALKGSVTLDGVSLTIQGLTAEGFEIGLIPHTQGVTALKHLKTGQPVNLECDLLARYLERLLGVQPAASGLTLEGLAAMGY